MTNLREELDRLRALADRSLLAGVLIRVEPNALRDTVDAISARLAALEAVAEAAQGYRRAHSGQHTTGPQTILAQREAVRAMYAALNALAALEGQG